MRTKIELPPKYYLTHFQELRSLLQLQYAAFFEDRHHHFLSSFDLLSEDAQCLYLRFVNRKGKFFLKQTLKYPEITSIENSLEELSAAQFIHPPSEEHWKELLAFLPKQKLMQVATKVSLPFKRTWDREKIAEVLNDKSLVQHLHQELIVQGHVEELKYILFLYFGKIQDNLALYTLRDLGIRKTNEKTLFKPRYTNYSEAFSHYFYALLEEENSYQIPISEWPQVFNEETLQMRERALIKASDLFEGEEKLHILQMCSTYPGTEKYVRVLYQANRKDETQLRLNQMIDNPSSDLELIFAEDFYARKFDKKLTSVLTDILRCAQEISIDESYFRHPEEGAIAHFKNSGFISHHVENYLWSCLFGLVFWEELFESPKSSLSNPFERRPSDLHGEKFFKLHQEEIQTKLNHLSLESILLKAEIKKDKVNGIFGWHESIPCNLELLFSHSELSCIQHMLLYLAKDYNGRSTGFPDLMTIENNVLKFYEVKAEGDSLKRSQLMQIKALRKAGFSVEVLRVKYAFNPNQIYVVVDLETTGGMLPYHRITEIGAVKVQNGKVIDKFQTLVNPGRNISFEIQNLTGISNEMVRTAPAFKDVAESFRKFSEDGIFVAHNVNFDYSFLQAEFERLDQKFVRPFICTKVTMKKYYPGLASYSLKNLTQHFGIPLETHHRALCDAEAAAGLLALINKKRASNALTEDETT